MAKRTIRTAKHIPPLVSSKQSLNQECLESLGSYSDNVRDILDWVTQHKGKVLKRIAQKIEEAEDALTEDMSVGYQLKLLTNVTDMLLKLEAVRGAYLDRIKGLDIPSAPDIPTTARLINPELKQLSEIMLTIREKHGITTEALITAAAQLVESKRLLSDTKPNAEA